MAINTWRFPASNHAGARGISSGDIETFKKNPFSAFAREILQNSIDARSSDKEPVRVEFKLFDMATQNIPGLTALKESMRRCKEYWAHKPDYVKEYQGMIDILEQKSIKCLRVSDFNTTGLIGVESKKQENNKFLALAKGTGISEKSSETAGGSKGVGKNAAFLMSSVKTVIYATKTNKDLSGNAGDFIGAIGVSELVSGWVDDNDCENRDFTQGTGYYSSDEFNSALGELIELDLSFNIRKDKYGTDIYILGFNDEKEWDNDVINSLLNSFMAAIVRGELEVNVNGIEISKNNVEDIIYNEDIISKTNKSNVISQYRLLTNKDGMVLTFDIETEYGNCELYILPYKKEEDELATHKCAMIRHPLMKIRDEHLGQGFRVSAMCIIGDGKLGGKLRSIENAQHIDWETNRIKDLDERKEMQRVINEIKEQIKAYVIDSLKLGDNEPIDPNGAGDYLPDVDTGDYVSGYRGEQKPLDDVRVSQIKQNRTVVKNANQENENGNGLEPDIGAVDDNFDGDVQHPIGENDFNGENRHPGNESSAEKEGDNIIFKKQKLSGVKYKVISVDKNSGKIKIVFYAPIDYSECFLSISLLDDSNRPIGINIKSMRCNDKIVDSSDTREYGPFKIKMNQKYVLDVETDVKGYFASEVKIICK